jgi:phosphopantothenoylcysteine decarboxylase/phosphopantothenate--cysteine ligase
LGVSGGIAAYKAVEVLRLFQKAGCDVSVAMTRHATQFVQPLTFRALTERHVILDDYDPENPDPIAHINFSQNIDLLLVVPATANVIAKFANGIADDFLSSTYLASTAPVIIAPAMNTTMWEHPATQRNVERLRADGVHFVEPVAGELACKTVGTGKLEDVENIFEQAMRLLSEPRASAGGQLADNKYVVESVTVPELLHGEKSAANWPPADAGGSGTSAGSIGLSTVNDLAGERFLLTVGGTREPIDPVRFISNHSSGKMGYAIAEAAAARGAEVTVVSGLTSIDTAANVKVFRVISAGEMHRAVMRELPAATIFVGAAAVADYAPANMAGQKIKKGDGDTMTLTLAKTPDILADVARNRHPGLMVVGFAAETNDVIEYARSKMEKKGLDMVVANDITREGAGFNSDTNIATIITKAGDEIDLPLMTKREMADRILDALVTLRKGI